MKAVTIAMSAILIAAAVAICLFAPGYYGYLLGTLATTALVGVGLNVLLGLAGEVSLGAGRVSRARRLWRRYSHHQSRSEFLGSAAARGAAGRGDLGGAVDPRASRHRAVSGDGHHRVRLHCRVGVGGMANLTGGASGLSGIPAPFGTGGTALLACGFCALALVSFYWFVQSPLGLAMQATASAPAAARSVGIGPLPVRTVAFVLSAAAAGLAGGLQAALTGFIAPSSFPFSQSILFLLVVVRRRRRPHPRPAARRCRWWCCCRKRWRALPNIACWCSARDC